MSEAFSNVAMLFLISLPLAMATIGWVAATATARILSMGLTHRNHDPMSTPKAAGRALNMDHSQPFGPLLLRCAVVVAVIMAVVLFIEAR